MCKKLLLAIIIFPIAFTFGLLFIILLTLHRYIVVWQLSEKYKRKHKEFYIGGKFNPIQFVLGVDKDGDKGREEMWEK